MYNRRFIAITTLIGSCVASPCKPHSSFGITTIATFSTIEATSTTDTTDSWSAIETTKNVELMTTTTAVDTPTPLATFTLKVSNSVQMDLNGETIKIRDRSP